MSEWTLYNKWGVYYKRPYNIWNIGWDDISNWRYFKSGEFDSSKNIILPVPIRKLS